MENENRTHAVHNQSEFLSRRTKFCIHCGSAIPEIAIACMNCGRQVEIFSDRQPPDTAQ